MYFASSKNHHPRRLVAMAAAILGVAVCIYQGHVQIALLHPSTYSSPLHHKCGLLMLGCVSWAICEIFLGARKAVIACAPRSLD